MVSINPSDPDYRSATGTASATPMRELPLDPEPSGPFGLRSSFGPLSGVPWGGIIAGSVVTISLLALSTAFAVACDVPAYRGGDYGFGAGVWACLTSIVAFFVGAAVAGMVMPRERLGGAVRGMITWSLTIVLTVVLSMSTVGFLRAPSNIGAAVNPDALAMSINGAAWGTFIAMILGLAAAVVGGVFGGISARAMTTSRP